MILKKKVVHQLKKIENFYYFLLIIINYKIINYKMTSRIDIINSIDTSKNALDICNSIKCNNIEIRQKALEYGFTYKNIFNGYDNSNDAKKFLDIVSCKSKPKINSIKKTINFIKWQIYEINQKNIKNKAYDININKLDNNISEWIGSLSGLVLYFDEIDFMNFNNTNYASDVCKALNANDI